MYWSGIATFILFLFYVYPCTNLIINKLKLAVNLLNKMILNRTNFVCILWTWARENGHKNFNLTTWKRAACSVPLDQPLANKHTLACDISCSLRRCRCRNRLLLDVVIVHCLVL